MDFRVSNDVFNRDIILISIIYMFEPPWKLYSKQISIKHRRRQEGTMLIEHINLLSFL